MGFVIIKQVIETKDMEIISHHRTATSAKAKLYDLNKLDEVSYRDNKKRFFTVYKKGIFKNYAIYIYKILEVPEFLDSEEDLKKLRKI